MKHRLSTFLSLLLITSSALACASGAIAPTQASNAALTIRATSELALLDQAGIFKDFTTETGVTLELHFDRGSVELKLNIEAITKDHPSDVDVYVTSSPIWMPGSTIAGKTPIMMSVVTFPVDPAKERELGWNTQQGITVDDIIPAASQKRLAICSPSASQDDAATNFYVAVLSALKGTGETLRVEDMANPAIINPMKDFYSAVVAGASNTDLLWHQMLVDRTEGTAKCNAAVLPESAAIALNKELVAKGLAPMTVYYVDGATSLQTYTMGYVSSVDEAKQKQFQQLATFLKRPDIQARIQALGFRTSVVGITLSHPDTSVFNPAWGIDTKTEFLLTDLPKEAALVEAINVYQAEIRPASFTAYCLDYSGSMEGDGNRQLLVAMKALLDQESAATYFLQASPDDTTYVATFSSGIKNEYLVAGNSADKLAGLYDSIEREGVGGGTNIFGCAVHALQMIQQNNSGSQLSAVILLTDGANTEGADLNDASTKNFIEGAGIPIYSILLGDANPTQLQQIADLTNGAICDGRGGLEDLVRCFRSFKGNN